jgi:hypothetical protein
MLGKPSWGERVTFVCTFGSWTSLEFEELLERSGAPGTKKSEFMRLVDLNGDGLISYEEFMLFSTLAAIPASKVTRKPQAPQDKP